MAVEHEFDLKLTVTEAQEDQIRTKLGLSSNQDLGPHVARMVQEHILDAGPWDAKVDFTATKE